MSGCLIPKPKLTGKRVSLKCTRVTRKKRSKDTCYEYCRWGRKPLPEQYLVHPGVWGKRLIGCSSGRQNE